MKSNSEILYIYDAVRTNPNGDMDNQNKPRLDYDDMTNLVSDVRLKRYVRDYLNLYHDQELFITEEAEDAKKRGEQLKKSKKKHEELIDVRLFGAVYAESGNNTHLTGPVQFTWGSSLNRVELQESKTITSSFSSGEGVGKDYRVKYSILGFSGSLNGKIGEKARLTEDDVKLLDKAMIEAIPLSRTRSKVGQTPRLYLRVELKEGNYFLKDLREYIDISEKEGLSSIKDVRLEVEPLKIYLEKNKGKISKVFYYLDDLLCGKDGKELKIEDITGDLEAVDLTLEENKDSKE